MQTHNNRSGAPQQEGGRYLQPVLRVLSGCGIENKKGGDAQSTARTSTVAQSCRDGRNSHMGMTQRAKGW